MHRLRVDTLLQVSQLACERCIAALTRAVRRLDHTAHLEVRREARLVRIVSTADTPVLLGTLRRAGFSAEPVLQPLG